MRLIDADKLIVWLRNSNLPMLNNGVPYKFVIDTINRQEVFYCGGDE